MSARKPLGARSGAPREVFESKSVRQLVDLRKVRYAGYQRGRKDDWVSKIVKMFNPALVRDPLLSFRGGVYWCMDGQHTIAVLQRMGYTHAWCVVHKGLTEAQEAHLHFGYQANKRRVEQYDEYNALRIAGDADVLAMDAICSSLGYEVVPSGGGSSRDGHHIRAIGYLKQAYGLKDEKGEKGRYLRLGLGAMANWRDRSSTPIYGEVIAGAAHLFADAPPLQRDQVAKHLVDLTRDVTPKFMAHEISQTYAGLGTNSRSRGLIARDVLIVAINKERTRKRQKPIAFRRDRPSEKALQVDVGVAVRKAA